MVRDANESPTGDPLEINRHFCAAAELNKKIVSQWRLRQEVRSERLQEKSENAYEVLTRFDIKHITIPDGITEIRNQELAQCHCLESIDIPSSVTAIGSFGLAMCSSLKELVLPESLTYIGLLAFECCYGLKSLNIPNKVQYIGDKAFYACRSLEKISIPESVELIDGNIFADCSSLTEIAVSEANKEYCSVDGMLYTRDMSVLVSYPMGKKQKTFTVPSTVRKIESQTFYKCDYFEDIVITSPAIEFGTNAFAGCTGLSIEKQQALRNMGCDGDFECLDVGGLLAVTGTAAERKAFMDYMEKRHERLSKIEKFYGKIKHRCRKTVEEAVRERAYLRDFILKNADGRKHEAEAFMGDYGKELPL